MSRHLKSFKIYSRLKIPEYFLCRIFRLIYLQGSKSILQAETILLSNIETNYLNTPSVRGQFPPGFFFFTPGDEMLRIQAFWNVKKKLTMYKLRCIVFVLLLGTLAIRGNIHDYNHTRLLFRIFAIGFGIFINIYTPYLTYLTTVTCPWFAVSQSF